MTRRLVATLCSSLAACGGGDVSIVVDNDEDNDGWTAETDCDDTDPDVYPDAPELPDDGIDQDCDGLDSLTEFGFRDDLESTTITPDFLIGNAITFTNPLDLTHIGFSVRWPEGEARIGVYADDGGRPAALLLEAPAVTLEEGITEVALEEAVYLESGTYWVQGVFSEYADIGAGEEALVIYRDYPYADPLPDPYGIGSDYLGPRISFYVGGELPE